MTSNAIIKNVLVWILRRAGGRMVGQHEALQDFNFLYFALLSPLFCRSIYNIQSLNNKYCAPSQCAAAPFSFSKNTHTELKFMRDSLL
jgi:hypothetical protein